jgi:hypothetical protein
MSDPNLIMAIENLKNVISGVGLGIIVAIAAIVFILASKK